MPAAGWVRYGLAAAMLALALYHLVRLTLLVRARSRGRIDDSIDLDVAHAAMGTSMAAMLVGASSGPWLAVLFAGGVGWFVVRTVRGYVLTGARAMALPVQAGIGCVAMVAMLAGSAGVYSRDTMAASMATGGMPTVDYRLVALSLIIATVALTGWAVGRWWQQHRARPGSGLALGCQIAMNVTTITMLALR